MVVCHWECCSSKFLFRVLFAVCMSKGEKLQVHGVGRAHVVQLHSHSLAFRFLALFCTASVEKVHGHDQKIRHSQHD